MNSIPKKYIPPVDFDSKLVAESLILDDEYQDILTYQDYEKVEAEFEAAADKKKSFWTRIRRFATGRSKLGSTVGSVIDTVTFFVPYGRQINTGRDLLVSVIKKKEERKQKPMLKKVLSLKNFVNVKDEQGNLSIEEIGASVIQLGIAFGVVWGAVELGIFEEVMNFLQTQEN